MKLYGIAENVRLSDAELKKLEVKFGKDGAAERIEYFSLQKKAHGYRYKSDYAAILVWARKDEKTPAITIKSTIGENHVHICSSCRATTHKWECHGKDGDGWPCGMSQSVACPEYFRRLTESKKQLKLGL